MTTYQSPLESDDEYIHLLGLVTARWAMMEEAMAHLLGFSLGNFETGYEIYFCANSFRQRIELIKTTAVAELSEADSQSICDVANKVYDAFKARNKMVHEPYHLVLEDKDGEIYSTPFIYPDSGDVLKWLGRGRYYTPIKINKGSFTGHLERLDRLMGDVVEAMDIVKQYPENK